MEEFEDFLLRYPQKGDSLFRENISAHYDVNLDPYLTLGPLGDNWYKYLSAYKEAADILVNKIINDRSVQDYFVLPTIYLYRHSIELSLKLIIRYGSELYDESDYRQIHDLDKLWFHCRSIIEKNWPKEQKYCEILNATEKLIEELSKIDPTGEESRYPEKPTIKKKQKTIKNINDNIVSTEIDKRLTLENIPNINLQNMRNLLEKLYNFLGDMCPDNELSEKRDIESEYNY
jgi:hypothetical protein